MSVSASSWRLFDDNEVEEEEVEDEEDAVFAVAAICDCCIVVFFVDPMHDLN